MRTSALLESPSDVEHCVVHAVLDQLASGVALLDPKLKVQFVNKAFRAMASDGALVLRGQSLSSASPPYAGKLDHLTRSVLTGSPGGAIAVPHPKDGRLITILVTSVRSRDAFSVLHL